MRSFVGNWAWLTPAPCTVLMGFWCSICFIFGMKEQEDGLDVLVLPPAVHMTMLNVRTIELTIERCVLTQRMNLKLGRSGSLPYLRQQL